MTGWIKLPRSITETDLWNKKPFDKCRAWIDLLLRANYEAKDWLCGASLVHIEKGSLVTSQRQLMKDWGWSREKVQAFLKTLHTSQKITQKIHKNYTYISIMNWEGYDTSHSTNRAQTAHKPDHKTTTTKEERNKEDKNILPVIPEGAPSQVRETAQKKKSTIDVLPDWVIADPDLHQAVQDWIQHRIEIKAPWTPTSAKQVFKNYKDRPNDLKQAIQYTIEKGWQGLREPNNITPMVSPTPRPQSFNTGQIDFNRLPMSAKTAMMNEAAGEEFLKRRQEKRDLENKTLIEVENDNRQANKNRIGSLILDLSKRLPNASGH